MPENLSELFILFFEVNNRVQDYTYGEVMGKAPLRIPFHPCPTYLDIQHY